LVIYSEDVKFRGLVFLTNLYLSLWACSAELAYSKSKKNCGCIFVELFSVEWHIVEEKQSDDFYPVCNSTWGEFGQRKTVLFYISRTNEANHTEYFLLLWNINLVY